MRAGLFAPFTNPFATPEYIEAFGRGAEERGFSSIWVAEHVVLFDEYASKYPYSADGKIPAGGEHGIVGAPPEGLNVKAFSLIGGRRSLCGSPIGGLRETQEMLDFCAANNIVCDVEVIPIQQIELAYARMLKSDVKYRFVIDMTSLGS